MAHKIIIMDESGGRTGAHGSGEVSERAAVEETVSQMIATLPRMFRSIKRQARNMEVDHPTKDLGDSQVWVLHALAVCPQLTTELARTFNVTNPTMTKIVDGLVERGYVTRRPDLEDRRRIYLELTEPGMEIARFAHEQFRSTLAQFISPLSDSQLADVALACRHLSTLLPKEGYDLNVLYPPAGGKTPGMNAPAAEQSHKSQELVTQTEDR